MATDLLIVTDATASMGTYLDSLRSSIPEIVHISELTGCFERIGIIAYTDYDSHNNAVTHWSGWYHTKRVGSLGLDPLESGSEFESGSESKPVEGDRVTLDDVLGFVDRFKMSGGASFPEAAKSGLSLAYHKTRADAETVVLLYADAPPHTAHAGGEHYLREKLMLGLDGTQTESKEALLAAGLAAGADKRWVETVLLHDRTLLPPFGDDDAGFNDWVSATRLTGSKMRVFCMIERSVYDRISMCTMFDDMYKIFDDSLSMYTYLSAKTGGACFQVPMSVHAASISAFSVSLVLAVMGVTGSANNSGTEIGAAGWRAFQSWALDKSTTVGWHLQSYKDTEDLDNIKDEDDGLAHKFFYTGDNLRRHALDKETDVADLYKYLPVTSAMKSLAPTASEVTDPAKRYQTDQAYRAFVTAKLEEILKRNAAAVTRNPVFGALWRAICSDRQNEARPHLLNLFSVGIDKISNPDEKAMAKTWLEDSYDYVGDILHILDAVPAEERFPCVYLDPTQTFSEDGPLTRDELLEISRSCDGRILSRVGRVLTRLTYAASAGDLPVHIKTAVDANVRDPAEPGFLPLIPLSLQSATKDAKRGRMFWRILLHTIVPGTMLSARPAALVAALSLRMGIAPLRDVADHELVAACKTNMWNNLDIPETWNTSCLGLLLAADAGYSARGGADAVLVPGDRQLFSTLVDYKHLESNLVSTLTARVGWTPDKTKAPLGPTVVCRVCKFPRSVTMMAGGGVCGLCYNEYANGDDPERKVKSVRSAKETARMVVANVSATDSAEATSLWWVECAVRQCRAQYVIYNPNMLHARPKCWYCRCDGLSAGTIMEYKADKTDSVPAPVKESSAPTVECNKCLSRILWPKAYRPEAFDEAAYECSACASCSVATVVDTEVTARALEAENGLAWLLRNDNSKIAEPFSDRSVYHTIKTAGADGFAESVGVFPLDDLSLKLELNGKLVFNTPALVDELRAWVKSRRAQGESCSLCFSTFYGARSRDHKLRRACGRTGCAQRVCEDCFTSWYGINQRGRLLNIAALSCPFCRRQPAPSAVSAVGNSMHTLSNLREAVANAGTWVYAWCTDCGTAKEYAERVCAQQIDGAAEHLRDWRCIECTPLVKGHVAVACVKECPGCKTPTEKTGGCDHITCVVLGCDTHWCFFCGKAVSASQIYVHMSTAHGGWFNEGQNDEELEWDTEE